MWKFSMPSRTVLLYGAAAVATITILPWLHIRPLGILFLATFVFWVCKTRCNLRVVAPPELQAKYDNFCERFASLRQTNPKMFCAITSGCLGTLAILGHLISGSTVVLLGLVLAAIISTKFNLKLIRIEHKDFAWSEKLHADAELDDEFLPEVNESNICVLERASDLATLSSPTEDADADEDKSDEIPSELLIPDPIPEIDENYTDGDDEDDDDLVPIVHRKDAPTAAAASTSAYVSTVATVAAATARDDEIAFKKGHFKRDSSLSTTSSSDEESLSKGLKFPDHTTVVDAANARQRQLQQQQQQQANADATDLVVAAVKSQTQSLLANSGKVLPSLVSGLVQWGMNVGGGGGAVQGTVSEPASRRVVTALDSSDESDFEILENDDFK